MMSLIVSPEAWRCTTSLPDVFAAGDCVITHHRLLGETYLPLGTTAHKQGRVAGENALGGNREFAGSLGTQVVKVFDMVAARTGLREHEAMAERVTISRNLLNPSTLKEPSLPANFPSNSEARAIVKTGLIRRTSGAIPSPRQAVRTRDHP